MALVGGYSRTARYYGSVATYSPWGITDVLEHTNIWGA